jgi:putative glycosyltransferase (TIGR04348 family)
MAMKINLITPAGKQSKSGNRITANRWGRILNELGHNVSMLPEQPDLNLDIMIAIHAWRSHKEIRAFSKKYPDRPLIVLLAGTDIYSFQTSHPAETHDSMERATALVCLHDLVAKSIPDRFREKLHVIRQSAKPFLAPRAPAKRRFEVCVVGHLRDEKDSLRAATAARSIPKDSRLHIVHLGKSHNPEWKMKALQEAEENPRFEWRGEVPNWAVRRQYQRSHAMVISSKMEGGANVVSEAIACGLPILASNIDGNIGLLGRNYDGYFKLGDENDLADLLWRAESDAKFLALLTLQIKEKQNLFKPEVEKASWDKLLKTLS